MERLEKEEIIEKIKLFIGCENYSEDSENYYFQINRFSETIKLFLSKKAFEDSCELYFKLNQSKLGGLVSESFYEIHVNSERNNFIELPLILNDKENEIEYKIQKPSLTYIIYLILNITNPRVFMRVFRYNMKDKEDTVISFENFFSDVYRTNSRIITVSVKSSKPISESKLETLLQGFVFQLCYNLETIYILPSSFEDFSIRKSYNNWTRKTASDELESPKRKYISELINFYQQAMSTDSAFLKYLAFYHVLEYFF